MALILSASSSLYACSSTGIYPTASCPATGEASFHDEIGFYLSTEAKLRSILSGLACVNNGNLTCQRANCPAPAHSEVLESSSNEEPRTGSEGLECANPQPESSFVDTKLGDEVALENSRSEGVICCRICDSYAWSVGRKCVLTRRRSIRKTHSGMECS